MSLDGFIAGPQGEADWIEMDPSVDVAAFFREFSTRSSTSPSWGDSANVFSRRLPPGPRDGVTVVGEGGIELLEELRAGNGRDIWPSAVGLGSSAAWPPRLGLSMPRN